MFRVQFTPDAKALIAKMLSDSKLSRPGIMIHRQGPIAENSRAPSGQTAWRIERPHPWNVRLGDFATIRDNDEDVHIVEGIRVWLALVPKADEAGVEVSVRNGELHVDAIAA